MILEHELLARAKALAGKSLSDVAKARGIPVPDNLLRQKGWIGEIIEQALGANQGSAKGPDFPELGIELKTIPINANGQARETTFVCTLPLTNIIGESWQQSNLYQKLKKILWLPIEAEPHIALAKRRIGHALLWTPSETQLNILHQDWSEIMERVQLGDIESITTDIGQYLQVRPKAANRQALSQAYAPDGELIQTLPRGFYLRTCFTNTILQDHYHPASVELMKEPI